ncbi:unnamed protein product [marine sediment metagenome]|uniref:Uncharacterized protein n=1 Tax=marine sediment metagenome TaxID=412755 RepID=X1M970_9ZZZZ
MFKEVVDKDRIEHFSVGDVVRQLDEVVRDKKKKKELILFLEKNYRGYLSLEEIIFALEKRSTKFLLPSELILALAKNGAKVVVTDIDQKDCEEVVKEIEKLGSEGLALKLDVTNEEDIKKVVKLTKEKFGRIDILVNNAGICLLEEPVKMDLTAVEKTLNVNLKGLIGLTYAVLPQMLEQKYGKIVNITSIAAMVSWSKIYTYSATKGGVIGFTKDWLEILLSME